MDWSWQPFDALGARDLHDILRLRSEVFVVEQQCCYADVDGQDVVAHHLWLRREGVVVAALRAFPPSPRRGAHVAHSEDVVIGRVVVAPEGRGEGLGRALMREGIAACARTWGPAPVWLAAQAHLSGWYGGLGFEVAGPGFDEDDIPHLPMRRQPSR